MPPVQARKPNRHSQPDIGRDCDLNSEKVLDGWSVSHAVRELIANALDEHVLSRTPPIEISKRVETEWRIRDFGRGFRHTHLTQNENPEKRRHEGEVIGRFGVGLQDALAVLAGPSRAFRTLIRQTAEISLERVGRR